MTSAKSKEIADEYISSLSDLTINSKPLINMLTMLAEDNVEHAPAIVQAVENHLQKVRSDIKLPVLYLIDSIVKNVNGTYLNLFTQNIVNTFCGVFEKVDENTRASMWKLRQTWNDVFPAKKLFSLDVRVQSIDPAWPITASPTSISSGSIHVNPRFLSMPQQTATSIVQPIVPPVKLPPGDPVSTTEAVMREQLLKKQRELLELQKKKIELELLQAKASLEQQQRQLDKQAGSLKTDIVVPSTTTVRPSTESTTQGKPTTPVVSSPTPKQVTKQFPAAAASLLKNAGTNNGPRIAPASSIAVASARPMSRDPRLKTASVQEVTTTDPRQRQSTTGQKEIRSGEGQTQLAPNINTVLSDQLKHQLLPKQAVTSTINKPPTNLAGSDTQTINASNNTNANTNLNNNNKSFSGNANKDAVSHRTSQKKDPRSSSNNSNNLNSNCSKSAQSSSLNSSSSTLSGSNRGGGGSDIKTKDVKSLSSRSSSSSTIDKSSTSSKSSYRKIGNKSRSKQPQSSPSKVPKVDRDSSPVRSKSREKDSGDSSPSSRTSPQSSFQTSKNRKKIKSRKRSPSSPYRIPRRNDTKSNSSLSSSGGVTEEEQSGSLIVSPPHPPTFKEIRPNARQRNYVRRNKDDSLSPERSPVNSGNVQVTTEPTLESSSKDEDLRATLPLPGTNTTVAEKKEDLDLRVLPPVNTNKRQSTEHLEPTAIKKTKAEKFDALFGNEDVDLRTLTHPKAGRPPTPPPPVISGEDGKDSWAKLKTPSKNDREKQVNNNDDKRDRDRNRDRLGRLRLYNKLPDDPKDRRRTLSNEDQDSRPGRRGRENDKPERNEDRNIEIIMKQAAEQLNQGSITKTQYNTLIQEVLHMSEDRKLRAAQRKEKEAGSIVWEKGVSLDINGPVDRTPNFSPSGEKEVIRSKDHPIPRNPNGPRWQSQPWQQPGPWAHPPGPPYGGPQAHFNADFRPVGPWQNPRHFGPMRPDYQYHGGYNHNIGPNPRLGPGMMGPIGPNGPIISNLLPNGPIGPIGMPNPSLSLSGMNGPGIIMNNGPIPSLMSNPNIPSLSTGRNVSPNATATKYDLEDGDQNYNAALPKNQGPHSRELPPPDSQLLDEIARDTMKSINIDNIPREIRYYGQTGVVFMNWDDPREIGFQDGVRRILIDDKDTITCAFNDQYKEFMYDGEVHRIKLGAPTRELYVDDRWYECYFGGMPVTIELGGKKVNIKLEGPPPQVKIGTVKRTDLVVAKINLIINARNMVPVFLDAKPQIFEIEGKPHTLEFIDALQTVLLNGRPFKVEFGGLPKPIIVRDKKHFIRFSVLPRGIRAGYVKIAGMRGEEPIEAPSTPPLLNQKPKIDTTPTPTQLPSIEQESTSQDGSDLISTPKPDLQLDILSSVLPSAMAPSSGLSYQAEPVENPPTSTPALSLPLNMNELFQRLVETGIVPNLTEKKKQEEEEKKDPEIIPVSFDKPETLKVKQPAIAAALYSGMQCSSCGARFAPELATRYSHHLDWHFRQNRRERDSARKAHSRPWYYDVSDWIQFEEIEDLEDRAQSWFETEKQTAEIEGIATEDTPQETQQPSVPTGSDEDSRCQVCHDAFEQFYNEEKEEWHLRPAISYEGKNFHPLCLEDYKEKSLVRALEKTALALEETIGEMEDEKKSGIEESIIEEIKIQDSKIESDIVEQSIAEREDIVLTEEQKTPEIEDSEDHLSLENIENQQQDEKMEDEKIENTDNDKLNIEELEKIDIHLRTDEEKSQSEVVESNSFENIKIKEEPLDEIEEQIEEQFDFTNVDIKEEPTEPEPDPEESIVSEHATVDTTYAAVKSSIDGNVELDSTPATLPTAPSRIKINITKPLNTSKEPEEPKEKQIVEPQIEEHTEPLVPASIKPTLLGRKLSTLPPVEKGQELSGLCSIM
ncbi:pre-mRNA cleavage complex 2 protein Pcf11 isoform X1 [Vespa velutina]|uniref:pre-mRNA cleavage complex 2 protein Pcf11 isoform X1 n=1 Tax=Vespa velutina TaxID=202808 RepID=UPI001FB474AF|nr:pre-mRNA cleavage complex 2 protein Pcf11 isoform X1 [Vespa velutina]